MYVLHLYVACKCGAGHGPVGAAVPALRGARAQPAAVAARRGRAGQRRVARQAAGAARAAHAGIPRAVLRGEVGTPHSTSDVVESGQLK